MLDSQCRECSVTLIVGENWKEYRADPRQNKRICNDCSRILARRNFYRRKGLPVPDLKRGEMPNICNDCKCELIPGVNWTSSRQKWKCRICGKCDHKRSAAWQKRNPERAKAAKRESNNRPHNAAKRAADTMLRNRNVAKQTPKWANRSAILAFQVLKRRLNRGKAKDDPARWSIDHIIPIKGVTLEGYPVSGLHVENNLQLVSLSNNSRKHAKYYPSWDIQQRPPF